MIQRLLAQLSLKRRYALAVSRAQGRREILCAFEDAADADQAALATHATETEPRSGWASQRVFNLDDEAERRILTIAGPGQPRHLRRRQASG